MRIAFIFVALVFAVDALAQSALPSSRRDSLLNVFTPTGIRIGTDILSLVKDARQDNFTGWEVQGDIDFSRYLLAFEYGEWGRSFGTDSARYSNDGTYWRTGIDVNFLTRDPDRNIFFIGGRYGRSSYSEQMTLVEDDPLWGVVNRDYTNTAMKARWFELTTGIKVRMWKFIWLGYTARFKFGLKDDESRRMLSSDVPGYGRTHKDSHWGFNYQIMFRIPLRKPPPVPAKK